MYWTRDSRVDVDLVGRVEQQAQTDVAFVGSIKWRANAPFGRDDLLDLAAHRANVPGADRALLVRVSCSGFATNELDVALGAADIVDAWRTTGTA